MCVWVMVVMKGLVVRDVLSEDRTQNSCFQLCRHGDPRQGGLTVPFIDIRQLCGFRRDTSPP